MSGPQILPDILKIKSDIKEIRDNQLTGKYYTPEFDTSVNRQSTTITANPLPSTWTGSGNSYSNGGYMIESNMSPNSTNNTLDKAFNGNPDDGFISATWSGGGSREIIITLPESLKITSIETYIQNPDGVISYVSLHGSNDKSVWSSNLAVVDFSSPYLVITQIVKPTAYKYYKLEFLAEDGRSGQISVREFRINKYDITTYNTKFTLSSIPNPLAVDQRIMIKTPSELSTVGVSINTFNGKDIDILLQPNRYYELVYNGSMYLAKEVI